MTVLLQDLMLIQKKKTITVTIRLFIHPRTTKKSFIIFSYYMISQKLPFFSLFCWTGLETFTSIFKSPWLVNYIQGLIKYNIYKGNLQV